MKKNTSSNLIFPSDNPSFEEVSAIKQVLAAAGFPHQDQEWLVQVFERSDCFGDPESASVFREDFTEFFEHVLPGVVDALGDPVQSVTDRQNRLALLFSFLLGFGPIYSEVVRPRVRLEKSNDEWKRPDWMGEFQRQATFCATKLDWEKLYEIRNSRSFLFHDLVPFLFPQGFPLNQVIELDSLNAIQRRGWSSNDFGHPNLLEFWLIWRFNDNPRRCETVRLDTLLPIFREYPETELSEKILGLLNAVTYALNIALGPGAALNEGWRLVARELLPFLELLNEKHPESYQGRSTLIKSWWRLSQKIYGWSMGRLESELPQDLRDRLVESASRHLEMLRKTLRESPKEFKESDAPDVPVSDFYKDAFYALLCFAPPWKRLRLLLLAFTEMAVKAVTSDLRPWPELDREPPPDPYSDIPMWIEISMYPQNLKDELERDPYLRDLREQFAGFCLARLKTKQSGIANTNEDFVEPRPVWRRCYVQALQALQVNPGGRAHKTLFWTTNNDPDEEVRKVAKLAHRQIRRLDRGKPNLDVGASPRRPLFEAFWWLRQAHLLTLGVEIDKPGAQRTLRKDLSRTRERDDFPRRRRTS
ncbi:MAG: hypothetical protein OXN17_04080 [Candidatus Poribacteria bacterium]|nr:hypothetical protein [Candidatus Poribacteria bacterium]